LFRVPSAAQHVLQWQYLRERVYASYVVHLIFRFENIISISTLGFRVIEKFERDATSTNYKLDLKPSNLYMKINIRRQATA
jgi:hypothetical protein